MSSPGAMPSYPAAVFPKSNSTRNVGAFIWSARSGRFANKGGKSTKAYSSTWHRSVGTTSTKTTHVIAGELPASSFGRIFDRFAGFRDRQQNHIPLCCSLRRGFHDAIGTVRTMLVPWPTVVWISNFPSIFEALVRMLPNPKPSLFSRLALEIPDPLSFT